MIVTMFRFHVLFRLEECTTPSIIQSVWTPCPTLTLVITSHCVYVFCFLLLFVFCFFDAHMEQENEKIQDIDISNHNQQNYETKRAFKQYTVQNNKNTTRKGTLGARNGALLRAALGTLRLGRWVILSVPGDTRCPEPRKFAPHRLECHPEPRRQLEKK